MEFFTTVDYIGQGLPILLPKGARIIQLLQRFVEDEEQKRGWLLTKTPFMAKSDLYKISGHWDHYKDGMFVLGDENKDKEVFALRPMTCPFQYQAYLNEPTRVSMYFFISAFIFGSGIAFTGVAGSGLVRNAFNLKLDYIVALIMYFIGSVCGVLIREYFISRFSEMSLYMPELFGWPVAIITQIALMYGYYRVIKNAERIYVK